MSLPTTNTQLDNQLESASNQHSQISPQTPITQDPHTVSNQAHQIAIAPQTLFSLGPLPVTNTLMMSVFISLLLIFVSFFSTRRLSLVPGKFQNFLEIIIETGYKTTSDLAHSRAKVFFPLCMAFFLFIVVANWVGLLPGMGTIYLKETVDGHIANVPIFRAVNSDLNMTLGLALISAAATHYFAVKYLGWKNYFKKWFSLNLILLFVGILEIVSEFTKVFSLSFRLFGNVFAGEEVLKTVSNLFAFIAPLPFYFLEIIVGFVQAAVFMMLTLVFMVLLSEKHQEH